jgi:hypothetical protein
VSLKFREDKKISDNQGKQSEFPARKTESIRGQYNTHQSSFSLSLASLIKAWTSDFICADPSFG